VTRVLWLVSGVSLVGGNESLCVTCVWSFVRSAWRNPLAFAMRRIVFRSFCLHEGVGGNGSILLWRKRKTANLCSKGVIRIEVDRCVSRFCENFYFKFLLGSVEKKMQRVDIDVCLKCRCELY
jgi:hypothetical protein